MLTVRWQLNLHDCSSVQIIPSPAEDQMAKLQLCSKYLETFPQIKERERCFAALSIDLLVGMREMLTSGPVVHHYLSGQT